MADKPKCQRCGDCCKAYTLLKDASLLLKITARIIYFLKGKSIKTTQCKYLKFKHGLAVCKIHKNKPKFCKEFFCSKCYAKKPPPEKNNKIKEGKEKPTPEGTYKTFFCCKPTPEEVYETFKRDRELET